MDSRSVSMDDCEEISAPTGEETNSSATGGKRKSGILDEFITYKDANGKDRARYKTCKVQTYAIGSSTHGTTNLKKHFSKCPKRKNMDVSQMLLDHGVSLRAKQMSQDVYREKMAIAIMKHNIAYSFVEYEGIRDVHDYLNCDVKPYTRNTAKADCLKIYKREREALKNELMRVSGRICLTSDVWSSITSEGYICLTAHYVDANWKLQNKILNFCHFPPPHNGVCLAEKVFQFLKEWGIEKKIFSITLDNATSCDTMQDILKNHLRVQNALLCGGEFFHVRCFAHILNLIVQDGLKIASVALHKIRESVKYVKGSEGRIRKFGECCEQVGLEISMGLRLDVITRWNSTFLMLESAIKYRRAFDHYSLLEAGYKTCPSEDEWNRGEKIAKFLKPFADITELISGSQYTTANLYFQSVWLIHTTLEDAMESTDDDIRDMAHKMMPKFEKYWSSYSILLGMSAVLDPRYKMQFVEYCYKTIHIFTWTSKLEILKQQMKWLYDEYASVISSKPPESIKDPIANIHDTDEDDKLEAFDTYVSQQPNLSTKSELDTYLDEPKLDRKQNMKLDVLEYWKSNSARFPILSSMARDIMSIPITSVASESAFSIGAKVLTKYRSSILPENVQVLICTRNWMTGYEVQSEDEEPCDKKLVVPLANPSMPPDYIESS